MSSDGLTMAVGAHGNDQGAGMDRDMAGHVRVFKFDGTAWVQMGDDIDGEAVRDESGYSVAMSSNGRMVAVGAPYNDGTGSSAGHVRTYALNGDWTSDAGGSSSTGATCFTGDSLLTLEEYVRFFPFFFSAFASTLVILLCLCLHCI